MENKKCDFTVDYSKMKIFECFNTDKMDFPLILSIPHSGTYFPPEVLEQVNDSGAEMRRNED